MKMELFKQLLIERLNDITIQLRDAHLLVDRLGEEIVELAGIINQTEKYSEKEFEDYIRLHFEQFDKYTKNRKK